jgi:hypothetical protein
VRGFGHHAVEICGGFITTLLFSLGAQLSLVAPSSITAVLSEPN